MGAAVARFELWLQTRGPVFGIVAAISFLMVMGSVGVDALRVGVPDGGARNGAEAVVRTHLVWTLFYLFTAAAFVGGAVLRDEESGFAPIVRAAPVRARDLLLGRFAGAFAATLLCFLTVPLALLLAPALPWVDPASVGPARPGALLFAFLVMAVPNLLLAAALGFGLASATRSMPAVLLAAVALLILYGLGAREGASVPAWAEPFGIAAYDRAVRGWPAATRDAAVPWADGTLLLNRALAIGLAVAMLAAALATYRRMPGGERRKALPAGPPPAHAWRPAPPRFDTSARLAQFAARARLEAAQVLRTPVFLALLGMGPANAVVSLRGLPTQADDARLVSTLVQAFALVPIVTVLFFAGELVWREKERRLDGLVGAAPISPGVLVGAKLLALLALLAGLALVAAACGAVVMGPDRLAALAAWATIAWAEWAQLAILAVALQVLSPNKLAGWGLFVLYLIASLTLERLGLTDPLYRFARYPGWPLPPAVSGAERAWSFLFGWALAAALLLALALSLRGRSAAGVRWRARPRHPRPETKQRAS